MAATPWILECLTCTHTWIEETGPHMDALHLLESIEECPKCGTNIIVIPALMTLDPSYQLCYNPPTPKGDHP